jgi:hypothetical protein
MGQTTAESGTERRSLSCPIAIGGKADVIKKRRSCQPDAITHIFSAAVASLNSFLVRPATRLACPTVAGSNSAKAYSPADWRSRSPACQSAGVRFGRKLKLSD